MRTSGWMAVAFVLLGCTSVEFATGGAGSGASASTNTGGSSDGGSAGFGGQSTGGGGASDTTTTGPGASGAGGSGGAPECMPSPSFDEDPMHCGSCNHTCSVGSCAGGECQPVELDDGDLSEGRGLTIAEDRVVWLLDGQSSSNRGVWSLPVTAEPGDAPEQIHQTTGTRIAYRAPNLYWISSVINSYDLVQEDFNQTFPSPGLPTCADYFALDGQGRLYCRVDFGSQESVRRFTSPTAFGGFDLSWSTNSYDYVRGMVVIGDDLWFGRGAGLTRWPLDDGDDETVESELVPGDVVAFGTTLFFGAENGALQQLMTYTIGDAAVSVLTPQLDAEHLHADAFAVYVAGEDASTISRVHRTTGSIEATWTVGGTTIRGLAGTPTDLFFTTEDGRLFRMTK